MFNIIKNDKFTGQGSPLFTRCIAQDAASLHKKIDGYAPTPLISLKKLASKLGVKNIFIKDESSRFGLNAFKVLGGSYALAKLLTDQLGIDIDQFDLKKIQGLLKEPLIFTTATAGNHGTGIAWAAREMGQKAIVFMPKGADESSVNRIRALGAECIVTELNYDDTVRLASQTANLNGWSLVQDTAWEGYSIIPTWISQGYMTMADEALEQLDLAGEKPTHVMLQAGVGAMAGGILGYLVDALGHDTFKTIVSEPIAADCLYRSVQDKTGNLVAVEGELDSIMAGLACGEVNPVTWPVLKDSASYFAHVNDAVSATGMRILGNPLKGDQAIESGPSGAINLGLLYAILINPQNQIFREQLGLDETSSILIFNTEGSVNTELYQKIVWEGMYAF